MNHSAENFFKKYPHNEDKMLDLRNAVANWGEIPSQPQHSFWLDFRDNEDNSSLLQVRNSRLDLESAVWLTVLPSRLEQVNTGFESGNHYYANLETAFDLLFSDESTFDTIEQLITEELQLRNFCFIPGEAFEGFDVFDALNHHTRESQYQWLETWYQEIFNRPRNELCEISGGYGFDSESTDTWTFEIGDKCGGFFLLKGLSERMTEKTEELLCLLSQKLCRYQQFLQLRQDNKLAEFEKEISDSVFMNVNEGLILTDSKPEILYINPRITEMFGFTGEEVIGHKTEDLLVTSSPDILSNLLRSENAESNIIYFHHRSGTSFPCRVRVRTVKSDGESCRLIIISDQTQSEETRMQNETLSNRAFLGDFSSMLAHEIRNPVNNMGIWLANIRDDAQDSPDILDAVSRIEADCQRVSQLVTNILSFSKPLAINREEINLVLLISEVIGKWRLNLDRKNIECSFNPPESFPNFLGDPRTLEQVLNNLIGNSIDALDNRGGVIILKLAIKENAQGIKQISITESDNGPGIPPDKIDHIFEPFVTSKKNGNGWGLAISKKIITQHKGTISVQSFQGGTVFEILLPLSE